MPWQATTRPLSDTFPPPTYIGGSSTTYIKECQTPEPRDLVSATDSLRRSLCCRNSSTCLGNRLFLCANFLGFRLILLGCHVSERRSSTYVCDVTITRTEMRGEERRGSGIKRGNWPVYTALHAKNSRIRVNISVLTRPKSTGFLVYFVDNRPLYTVPSIKIA